MKKKDLLLMVVVLLLLSSCSDEHEPSALSIRSVNEREGIDSLWCSGDNIEWYNGTTGEIKFKTRLPISYSTHWLYTSNLVVYLNDEKLISFIYTTDLSSTGYNLPCIVSETGGLYIRECTPGCNWAPGEGPIRPPEGSWWGPEDAWWDGFKAMLDENWKAIEPEWNIFIKQLKKEGRYRE